MKRVASPGSMHDTGCLGLGHWDDPEGWYGEGGGRRVQDGEQRGQIPLSLLPSHDRGIWPRDVLKKVSRGLSRVEDQLWIFIGRTDAEVLILCPSDAKSDWREKTLMLGKIWGQEEKGTTEDEVAGWHHRLNGHEFEYTPEVGDGHGGHVLFYIYYSILYFLSSVFLNLKAISQHIYLKLWNIES